MTKADTPTIGRIVHYMSYGTPNGEYEPLHRAAIVTAVYGTDATVAGLCVLNPTGIFFNEDCRYSEAHEGGTWHWPERI